MWSLGILTYEMASLEVPFDAEEIVGLMNKIVNSSYKPIPKFYSAELATFISVLLQKDPKNRPTCKALIKLPAIKKIEEYIKTRNGVILREVNLDLSSTSSNFDSSNENTYHQEYNLFKKPSLMAETIKFFGDYEELDLNL